MANTEILSKILSNDLCAKWINLRDYAFDKLSSNADIKAIMDMTDKKIVAGVPVMTSNTTPSGEAITSSAYSSYEAYRVFDGNASTYWNSDGLEGAYIGYHFTSPVIVKKIDYNNAPYNLDTRLHLSKFDFKGSNNGSDWTTIEHFDITDPLTPSKKEIFDVDNSTAYSYYALFRTDGGFSTQVQVGELQFYTEQLSTKYGLGEWVCEGQVPVMTSATAPYGTVTQSSQWSDAYAAWKAFDQDGTTSWILLQGYTEGWISYQFPTVKEVKYAKIHAGAYISTLIIQGSNDGTNWTDLTESLSNISNGWNKIDITKNRGLYTRYRVSLTMSAANQAVLQHIQFYAYQPKGNVPIMTSNTAPYGEAIVSSNVSGSEAYKAFDNDLTTFAGTASAAGQQNTYIGYHFVNPVCVKRFKAYLYNGAGQNGKIICQGSNDGSTWVDLTEEIDLGITSSDKVWINSDVDNDDYYLYYRIFTSQSSTTAGRFWYGFLQFYGREMKVSVPTMTSNTQPWGETSASGQDSTYQAWKAFSKTSRGWYYNYYPVDAWLKYDFNRSVKIQTVSAKFLIYSGVTFSMTAKIQGSNDNSTWDDLLVNFVIQQASGNPEFIGDIDTENEYRYYRLYITNSPGLNNTYGFQLNFFGFDYSERDWDTEHPMRYLYDHGVELEEITADGYSRSGTSIVPGTKEDNQLYLQPTGTSNYTYLGTNISIDLTDFDLIRIEVGNKNVLSDGNFGNLFAGSNKSDSNRLAYLTIADNKNMPYLLSLSVSSIENVCYIYANAGYNTRAMTITEWWLE